MNPAIIQAIALAIPALIAGTKSIMKGREKYVVAIAAYFVLRGWAQKAAKERALSELDGPNALATLYRQAMNPSGVPFLMSVDTTNVGLIYETAARRPQNYTDVYSAYQKQFDSDLTKDLMSELSNAEYNQFLTILGTNGGYAPSKPTTPTTTKRIRVVKATNLLDANDSTKVVTKLPIGAEADYLNSYVTNSGVKYTLIRYRNWLGWPTDGFVLSADIQFI